MTVKEFNEWYSKKFNKALSFVYCVDHALQKSDENAKVQFSVIGWDEETKEVLLHALKRYEEEQRKRIN